MDQGPASPVPRAGSRSFSFRSDKSANSSGGRPKLDDLTESPREKERRDTIWKSSSKANPNAAMNEAQPVEVGLLEKVTIEPLRDVQHKDTRGNVITDPDLSNPTRPRLERPLDTIRSFEKAIDSGYRRRTSIMRGEQGSDPNGQAGSRRNSYYGAGYSDYNRQSQYGGGGGYYGNRRPDSYLDNGIPQHQNRMRYGSSRMQSDSAVPRNGPWPQHNYQQSYETVGTAGTNGSDSTGQWANSTDPSSENSSIDRMNASEKPPYGGHGRISEEQGYAQYNSQQARQGYNAPGAYNGSKMNALAPSAPGRGPEEQRQPMGPASAPSTLRKNNLLPSVPRPEPEKRQSWLKRRFSKKI